MNHLSAVLLPSFLRQAITLPQMFLRKLRSGVLLFMSLLLPLIWSESPAENNARIRQLEKQIRELDEEIHRLNIIRNQVETGRVFLVPQGGLITYIDQSQLNEMILTHLVTGKIKNTAIFVRWLGSLKSTSIKAIDEVLAEMTADRSKAQDELWKLKVDQKNTAAGNRVTYVLDPSGTTVNKRHAMYPENWSINENGFYASNTMPWGKAQYYFTLPQQINLNKTDVEFIVEVTANPGQRYAPSMSITGELLSDGTVSCGALSENGKPDTGKKPAKCIAKEGMTTEYSYIKVSLGDGPEITYRYRRNQ